jgi:2,4-dienoyl-CoA reductase (NADPH2)
LGFHEMTREDIATLVGWFADAADRARRAGFDGVEIHGAHGYLLSSFLSPASNARTDEYGGTLENRARLLCDVIRAVKARVGGDLAVWVRLDAVEFASRTGSRLEDAQRSAELAEAAGADAIHERVRRPDQRRRSPTRRSHEPCTSRFPPNASSRAYAFR